MGKRPSGEKSAGKRAAGKDRRGSDRSRYEHMSHVYETDRRARNVLNHATFSGVVEEAVCSYSDDRYNPRRSFLVRLSPAKNFIAIIFPARSFPRPFFHHLFEYK